MISKIHNCYDHLTETEKRIAKAVLEDAEGVVNMTAKELAAAAKAAPSAVIRFCKSLGFDGFSDFKIALSAELGRSAAGAPRLAAKEGDDTETIFQKVFASGTNTLSDTLSTIDFSAADEIVSLLESASRVVFFGVGTSSVIATDAQYRFAQLGLATNACTDILFMNVAAANLKEGDVAVGISHSGQTKATVNALRRAKKAGAKTVAVSSFAKSPLAKESDHRIIAFSDDQNYPVEAVSARIAHTCILDALMMSLAIRKYDRLSGYLEERNEVLKEIRYGKR